MDQDKIKLFEDRPIRTAWDENHEEWYFSVIDVVGVLTESNDSAAYWRKLKQRLKAEGNETVTNCHSLKMVAADGKRRMTDVATTELTKVENPDGLEENLQVANAGGTVAGNARKEIEDRTGRSVITSQNAAQLNSVVTELIEIVASTETEDTE